MFLVIDGQTLPVSQMGQDFVFLESPINHAPAQAILHLKIDELERHWAVQLPQGISASQKRVQIAPPAS
jgi:hypothetical protein